MNFKEAKKQLKELANGKYHSIRYEITETQHGELIQMCEVYIADCELHRGASWSKAFESLAEELIDDVEELEELK